MINDFIKFHMNDLTKPLFANVTSVQKSLNSSVGLASDLYFQQTNKLVCHSLTPFNVYFVRIAKNMLICLNIYGKI